MRKLLLLLSTAAVACVEIGNYEEDFIDTAEEEGSWDDTVITVNWQSNGVTLEIENSDESGIYNWGITENAGSCLTSEWGCWTGEDCHMGFDLTEGGNYLYCHPVDSISSTLEYGASPDAVLEGATTVFGGPSFETLVTYVLDQSSSVEEETCWVWGADTVYYNGFYKTCLEM